MADNSITLVGNLTKDPELRFTTGGRGVASFGLAVSRRYQVNNEWQEQTSFFNVVAWGSLGENAAASLTKGTRVVVTGRLEQRTYETKEGEKRNVVEVIADEIGPSLRWAQAQIERVARDNTNGGGGNYGGGSSGGGGARGGGSSTSSTGGQSSDGGDTDGSENTASLQTVDVEGEGYEDLTANWGDALGIWGWPVLKVLDRRTHDLTVRLAPVSPLLSKLITDGAYTRALIGIFSAILPLAGVALALAAVGTNGGLLLPPPTLILIALAVIGVADAAAGALEHGVQSPRQWLLMLPGLGRHRHDRSGTAAHQGFTRAACLAQRPRRLR